EQSLRLYSTAQHHAFAFLGGFDPGVIAGIVGALTLWSAGHADQARHGMHTALALAHQVANAASLAHAALLAALLVQGHAEALMTLGAAYGWTHRLEQARFLRGWVLAMQGEAARGAAQIRQGLAALQGGGLQLLHPYCLAVLAEASGQAGQPVAGLEALAEA